MRTPDLVALRTNAIDSATTSRFSSFSRAIPISVSVPNWIIMLFVVHPAARLPRPLSYNTRAEPIFLSGPNRRQLDDVIGVKIRQFEPIFRDVRRRKEIIFRVLFLQCLGQVLARQLRLLLGLDGALDGQAFGPL